MNPSEFEKSIKKLSLPSVIILIGLLSQRAMELFAESNKKMNDLIKPDKTLILPQEK